jgi:hypothetical protein
MSKLGAVLIVGGLGLFALGRMDAGRAPVTETTASAPAPDVQVLRTQPEPTDPPTTMTPSSTSTSRSITPSTTTTVVAPTTTTTLVPVDRHEVDHPITQALPYETPRWSIDYRIDAANRLSLTITLLVVLNHPDQVATRRAALVAYRAEALGWLAERGVTARAYPITWRPAEAAQL